MSEVQRDYVGNIYLSGSEGVNLDVDLTQHFECSVCGHDEEVVVPFTADFFWPK